VTNNLSAGTEVRAIDFPPAVQSFQDTSITNISTTTYITGTPECAVWIMAPSSGRVAVCLSGGTRNNGANADRIFVSYRIFEGDPANGNLIQAEEVKRGLSNPATQVDNYQYHGHVTMVGGLTPGTYYYFQVRHRTTLGSATADISYRALLVWPIP
jgi:hypothetical protein